MAKPVLHLRRSLVRRRINSQLPLTTKWLCFATARLQRRPPPLPASPVSGRRAADIVDVPVRGRCKQRRLSGLCRHSTLCPSPWRARLFYLEATRKVAFALQSWVRGRGSRRRKASLGCYLFAPHSRQC